MRWNLCLLVALFLLCLGLAACGNGANRLSGSLAQDGTLTWALEHTSDTAGGRDLFQWANLPAIRRLGRFKHPLHPPKALFPHTVPRMWVRAYDSFVFLSEIAYAPVVKHEPARVVEVVSVGARTPAIRFDGPSLTTAGMAGNLKRLGARAEPATRRGRPAGTVYIEHDRNPFPFSVVEIGAHQVVFGKSAAADQALAHPIGPGLYGRRAYRVAGACLGNVEWAVILRDPSAFARSAASRGLLALGGRSAGKAVDNIICEAGLTKAQASTVTARLRHEWADRRNMPPAVKDFWAQISHSQAAEPTFDERPVVKDTVTLRIRSASAAFLDDVIEEGVNLEYVLDPRYKLSDRQNT